MTGTAPTISLTLDGTAPYAPNTRITATVTVSDPDTSSETLTAVDSEGRDVTETIARVDPENVAWSWKSGTSLSSTATRDDGTQILLLAPATTDVLLCAVTDGQGNVTTAAAAVSVVVQSPMLLGFDVSPLAGETAPTAFARVGKMLPDAQYIRAYNQPGRGFTQTPWPAILAAVPAGATIHVSTKDTPDPAAANPFLAAATKPWFWTIHHEPEGDLPVAQFKADQAAADKIIAAHPNGHLCTRTEIYTGYAQIHGNKPGYLVADMYSGATVIGFDMYRDGSVNGTTSYPDPAAFFAPLVNAAKKLVASDGRPPRIMVPEWGGTLIAGDDGTKRAAWIKACVAYLRSIGCVAVGWWFTGGEDLTGDKPGLAALQAAMTGK